MKAKVKGQEGSCSPLQSTRKNSSAETFCLLEASSERRLLSHAGAWVFIAWLWSSLVKGRRSRAFSLESHFQCVPLAGLWRRCTAALLPFCLRLHLIIWGMRWRLAVRQQPENKWAIFSHKALRSPTTHPSIQGITVAVPHRGRRDYENWSAKTLPSLLCKINTLVCRSRGRCSSSCLFWDPRGAVRGFTERNSGGAGCRKGWLFDSFHMRLLIFSIIWTRCSLLVIQKKMFGLEAKSHDPDWVSLDPAVEILFFRISQSTPVQHFCSTVNSECDCGRSCCHLLCCSVPWVENYPK